MSLPTNNLRDILRKLVSHPDAFRPADAHVALNEIMNGTATPAQTAAFLVACSLQHKNAHPEILAAFGKVMREHALKIVFEPELAAQVTDIVGTGGDGHNTFNVSTTAAIVAAGAGVKMAKHGNRASSSSSGSADILEACGCKLINVTPEFVPKYLSQHNFCFLFAQMYHPSMKNVASVRKEVGIPTVFNILGPLSNPAKPRRCVVGVHSHHIGEVMVNALKLTGVQRAMVVCGTEGLDEISCAGETHVWDLKEDGTISYYTVHPARDFGLMTHPLSTVIGGEPAQNVVTLQKVLANELPDNDPILDYVLLNTAAVLVVAGKASDFRQGVSLARDSIRQGKAKEALENFTRMSEMTVPFLAGTTHSLRTENEVLSLHIRDREAMLRSAKTDIDVRLKTSLQVLTDWVHHCKDLVLKEDGKETSGVETDDPMSGGVLQSLDHLETMMAQVFSTSWIAKQEPESPIASDSNASTSQPGLFEHVSDSRDQVQVSKPCPFARYGLTLTLEYLANGRATRYMPTTKSYAILNTSRQISTDASECTYETIELLEYLQFAKETAIDAGKIIKQALDNRYSGKAEAFVLEKYDNPADLVTETDQAVEKFIKHAIETRYPAHKFIGEETFAAGAKTEYTSDPTWIVDPVDGTTNFVHGFPYVAVSIGLTVNKVPVVGVVYNPLLNELYTAAKGHGAFLNESVRLPLCHPHPSLPLKSLSDCLIATEMGADRRSEILSAKIDAIHNFSSQPGQEGKRSYVSQAKAGGAHSVRSTGSAALNMCCVAKGIIDVYWEIGCWEWDVVAAMVIVQEAGGLCLHGTRPSFDPVNIFGRKYLIIRAAKPEEQRHIAESMWDLVTDIPAPRDDVPGGFTN
ncbi:hypothetical protein BZG36_01363 [Bifiguratus adelaidae]|uniref:Anthranilate phosphoribosyltransferase n=1 Tax=Bifiguratus adelaidae TaxID=1938954 RepID=A0A261Y3I4_9FUNG|nr:hypothetical protein BZG36_01363 [Bifiguratus adelaidae]